MPSQPVKLLSFNIAIAITINNYRFQTGLHHEQHKESKHRFLMVFAVLGCDGFMLS